MGKIQLAALCFFVSTPAIVLAAPFSTPAVRVAPDAGVETAVAVGMPVFERVRHTEVDGATLKAPMKVKFYKTVPAGAQLYRVESKSAFKACDIKTGHCGLDDDGDGSFDRAARDNATMALGLKEPVPYERSPIATNNDGSFRQVVTFLGVSGGVLRLSYREFVNDMARPAFTEDYSLDVGDTFPAAVTFRDVRMTVLGHEGGGLRYRIDDAGK